jgi:dienelactone hydrolase
MESNTLAFGSSRHSIRNTRVAHYLNEQNIATLLVSLETIDESLMHHGRSIQYLVDHLTAVTKWVRKSPLTRDLNVGYFGSSTGAAVALAAVARGKKFADTVVCRGGRPDLVIEELHKVQIPVLLIVGADDKEGIALNELAFDHLKCRKEMKIVQGASHLFEEKGKLKEVALMAGKWFHHHLTNSKDIVNALMIDSRSPAD